MPIDFATRLRCVVAVCSVLFALLSGRSAAAGEFFGPECSLQPFGETSPRLAAVPQVSPAAAVSAPDPVVYEVGKHLDFKAKWNNGLRFETVDRAFQLHVGGRIHLDSAFWLPDGGIEQGASGVGPLQDGVAFRRARIHISGKIYEVVQWAMEYGFETGTPVIFDVYGQINHLPLGSLRTGHFREPFSLDALSSGNYLPFMERSLFHDAFVPFRNTGISVQDAVRDETVTYAVGVFRSNSNSIGADAGDANYAGTGRLTFSPWHNPDERFALHLGASYSLRSLPRLNAAGVPDPNGLKRVRYATRPEIRVTSPNFINTGVIAADHSQLLGTELAMSAGSLLLQAEGMMVFVSGATAPGGSDLFFYGWYAEASWLLTGEHRAYDPAQGIFTGVRPFENYFYVPGSNGGRGVRGRGAWELGMRLSHIDATDGGIDGGRMYNLTAGLNWYLNPNCRCMFNYIHCWRDVGTNQNTADVLGTRFQVDF